MNPESKFLFPVPIYQVVAYEKLPLPDLVDWVETPAEAVKQPSVAEAAAYLLMRSALKKASRRTL